MQEGGRKADKGETTQEDRGPQPWSLGKDVSAGATEQGVWGDIPGVRGRQKTGTKVDELFRISNSFLP